MSQPRIRALSARAAEWDAILQQLPATHLLQTSEWAEIKAQSGWEPMPHVWEVDGADGPTVVAAAMVLRKRIIRRGMAARLSLLYVPKGPLMRWQDRRLRLTVLENLEALARQTGAILLKLDADVVTGLGMRDAAGATNDECGGEVIQDLRQRGWRFSGEQVQFRNTMVIDLALPEGTLLAQMKQKTRYNVRLAERRGVTIRIGTSNDLPRLYSMYAETSARDGFAIREEAYYLRVWRRFMQQEDVPDRPRAEPLIAEVEGTPVAGLFLFYFAGRAYYLYGMSTELHRDRMPNHLLQWEAMRQAKRRGCTAYDLWGAPDEFDETDPLWGVFRFKEGLGSTIVRTIGAWDYPARPFWYGVFTNLWPRVLDLMRARGKQRVRHDLAAA